MDTSLRHLDSYDMPEPAALDALAPGAELDALAAELLGGWTVLPDWRGGWFVRDTARNLSYGPVSGLDRPEWWFYVVPPPYSTDPGAAWWLIQQVHAAKAAVVIQSVFTEIGTLAGWRCTCGRESALSQTVMGAMTRAAVKWKCAWVRQDRLRPNSPHWLTRPKTPRPPLLAGHAAASDG